MKKICAFLIGLTLTLSSCSNSDDSQKSNPYLPNYGFDTGNMINTNLPQYSQLQFPGNYVIVNGYGINGFVLYSVGGNQFTAFDLTDPNHSLTNCSDLNIENGIFAYCNCDDGNNYDIVTGSPQEGTTGNYTLKPYFVEATDNIIRVYNN
ncbi:hypothetical protein [Mangrovimonas aestuarii]|uniref:hypothetical protein n=1 Tax=Mangrovimonas aestuarii TaxID=3018443 RepID=UPI002378759A|nr:hypothetical protein [Mangrovimonas aestuarii]